MYKLTKHGIKECEKFIAECVAKRKEILDAEIDTADDTFLPTIKDIEDEIEVFIDDDGEYYNFWGVTDNCNSDYAIALKIGIDFVKN